MTELETFALHARAMSTAEHNDECFELVSNHWGHVRAVVPDPRCAGCVSDADRALWARLADEVDAWLTHDEPTGKAAKVPEARTIAAVSDAGGEVDRSYTDGISGAQIGAERFEGDE